MIVRTPPAVPGLPRRPPARRGLTLLEALLSLVILLISLAAIASLVQYGVDQSTAGTLQTTGTRLAQSKLAEVEAGAVPVTSSASGGFEEEPEWTWTVTPADGGAPNVYAVTVRVSREHRGREFAVELSQMVFDPAMMGAATEAQPPETNSAGAPATGGTSSPTTGATSR